MQALRKVPHAEAKEEPGLRSGKRMTTQVVALAVMCKNARSVHAGVHGPVLWIG